LFSTINLQCFRTNLQNTSKKWHDGVNNPVNGSNPPRTTDQTTHDEVDKEGDYFPALPSDIPQAANGNNIFVCEIFSLYDGKGNETSFNYAQVMIFTSSMTSSGDFQSTENSILSFTLPLDESSPTRTLQVFAS
jgi:hypothetical protein